MRRKQSRLPIALLTLVAGLLIFAATQPRSKFIDCVIEMPDEVDGMFSESEIPKRFFVTTWELLSDVESPVYFLAEAEDRDVREQVFLDLQREGLPVRRLSQLGMNRSLTFDCLYCPNRQSKVVVRVGKIRWLNDKEVLVGASSRRWYLNADTAYLYRVVLEGNRWVIKDYELL